MLTGCEIVYGLSYLYRELKIVHDNINNTNILLTENGEVKIGEMAIHLLDTFGMLTTIKPISYI